MYLAIFIFIIAVLVTVLLIPLSVTFSFGEKNYLKLKFGIIPINLKFSKQKGKKAEQKNKSSDKKEKSEKTSFLEKFFCALAAFYNSERQIKKALKISEAEINAEIGTGDAAATGFSVGIIYAEIYKLFAFFSCIFTVNAPKVTVTPCYSDDPCAKASGRVKVKTTFLAIGIASVKFYIEYRACRLK